MRDRTRVLVVIVSVVLSGAGRTAPGQPNAGAGASGAGSVVEVGDAAAFRRALGEARPGTILRLAPGTYAGGFSAPNLRGEPGRPIVIEAADPKRPPVFEGGGTGLHLSDPAHLELRHLVVSGASGNGINIDDGGSFDTPAHHIVLRGLTVREIGPEGNHDGIKLSGVDEFLVEGCTLERWGSGGSGIDMVGCHRGRIVGCTFRKGGSEGVQAKGGSAEVLIQRCRFEDGGRRAVNLGGSTGMAFFRPRPQGYEAKDITVEDCTFVGGDAPVAFVGVDGSIVRHNTIYRPRRNALRILQETTEPGFVPSRNGQFTDNLIVFRRGDLIEPVNIGPNTAPQTFTLARNAWLNLDDPSRSQLKLPVAESDGVYGRDPRFRDAAQGDFRLVPDSPLAQFGARPDAAADK